MGSCLVTVQTSGLTGDGEQDFMLAIVPVKLKSKRGQRIVETYAFLDLGSSASFCTMGLMDRLNLSGRKNKDSFAHHRPRENCGQLYCIRLGSGWTGQWLVM